MLPLSEKDLEERRKREIEDSKRDLDKTVPGGLYINDAGFYHNAEGQYVDEHGKFVDEPVAAKDVQQRLEDEREAAAAAAVESTRVDAERRAAMDRRAAELAAQQAERTKDEADQAAKAAAPERSVPRKAER
jgi:hypothetical protein